jgi:hypothetical protein
MDIKLRELSLYLASCRASLLSAIDTVPPGRRHEAPRPDSWSVAQILEHLGLVESRIARLLVKQTASPGADGLRDETVGDTNLSAIDLAGIAGRSRKVVASEASRPVQNLSWSAAWTALQSSRDLLTSAIAEVDGIALDGIVARHPALGALNLYDWIAFVGAHELRHANQIRELAGDLAKHPVRNGDLEAERPQP